MPLDCPFCAQPNADHVLVCSSCSRDIAVPASLISERDDLILKVALVRDELARAKAEFERLRSRKNQAARAAAS